MATNVNTLLPVLAEHETIRSVSEMTERFAAQYREEPDFRSRVDTNPRAVLNDFGIDPSPGYDIRIEENSDEVFHIVMPSDPSAALSDANLDMITDLPEGHCQQQDPLSVGRFEAKIWCRQLHEGDIQGSKCCVQYPR